jgi:pimeloyl-ACP methyl ester carboxylesterase
VGPGPALAAPVSSGTAQTRVTAAPPADILTAPAQVARTTAGDVGYREVGTGSPLLLITGFSATMDDWAPSFVDALAAHHRVVVFDNAGVGETAALPGPLTISAMAGQTSALISALRLGRPAVLGWSMGGMIAQALAVQHPGQVSQLVLAATQAGTGMSLPIPPAAGPRLELPGWVAFPRRMPAHPAMRGVVSQRPARTGVPVRREEADGDYPESLS